MKKFEKWTGIVKIVNKSSDFPSGFKSKKRKIMDNQKMSKQQLINENVDLKNKLIIMANKLSKLSKHVKQLTQVN